MSRCRAPVEYKVVDATNMEYKHAFDVIIDKGTLDALHCGGFEVVEKLVMSMEYPLSFCSTLFDIVASLTV